MSRTFVKLWDAPPSRTSYYHIPHPHRSHVKCVNCGLDMYFLHLATCGGNVPCCSSPPQGDGNVAMPGPPAGAVVEDVLGLEDAVLMIAPGRPGKKTGLLTD